jgi:hypothetical protein
MRPIYGSDMHVVIEYVDIAQEKDTTTINDLIDYIRNLAHAENAHVVLLPQPRDVNYLHLILAEPDA